LKPENTLRSLNTSKVAILLCTTGAIAVVVRSTTTVKRKLERHIRLVNTLFFPLQVTEVLLQALKFVELLCAHPVHNVFIYWQLSIPLFGLRGLFCHCKEISEVKFDFCGT
jgi:hypothetical protein